MELRINTDFCFLNYFVYSLLMFLFLKIGSEEQLLREWLDCHITNTGILVAEQHATPRPALANQMMDEWLDRYRKMNKEMTKDTK